MSNVWIRLGLVVVCSSACDRAERRTEAPDAAQCGGMVERQATDYIPASARAIVSVQVGEVVDFERDVVGRDVLAEAGYGSVLDAMAACGMTRQSIGSVTVAVGSGQEEVIVVLEGEGIGEEDKLLCFEGEVGTRSLLHGWRVEKHGCDIRFVDDGETVGFVAGPDTLVAATPSWLVHARDVALGGKPTPPRKLVREIAKRRTASFGGDLDEYRDELAGLPLVGGLQTVVGWVDLDGGFELEVEGTYATREAASAVAHELEALRRRGRILAPEVGIPARLLDRVAVKHRGRDVVVTIDLSRADVRRIGDAIASKGA